MSKLQTHLHALPPGSLVNKGLAASNAVLHRQLDAQRKEEVLQARQHQQATGSTWPEAMRAVNRRYDQATTEAVQ
jgi:hypothetical protein